MKKDSFFSGFVRRFGDHNTTQMTKLKEALNLKMQLEQLQCCAKYYSGIKRDPSVEELELLDAIASLPIAPEAVMLSELYTNDSFVASTYADMMNKRRQVFPNADHPISLKEALELATLYLERSGKSRHIPDLFPCFREIEELDENTAGAMGSRQLLSLSNTANAVNFSEGDVLMLIHRGNTPTWKYRNNIGSFLSSDLIHQTAKQIFRVSREGLFSMFLSKCDGIIYDLRPLSPNGYEVTPVQLFEKFSDYYVLSLKKTDAEAITNAALAYGYRPLVFAAHYNDNKTCFLYSQTKSISFDTNFLRFLTSKRFARAKLPDEVTSDNTETSLESVGLHSCSYLQSETRPQRIKTALGATFSTANTHLTESPFRVSLQTALAATLSTAASGCAYTESRLAVSLRSPVMEQDNDQQVGELIASVLGVYRLQCELGIPASITSVRSDKDLEHPALDVFSVAPTQLLPSEFQKQGTLLYCISPALDDNGLPDFEALRSLLRELTEFCQQGNILSTRVLCNQSILDTVSKMETRAFTYHLTDATTLTGEAIPLAILLETSALLPYRRIGYVKEQNLPTVQESNLQLPKLSDTLNRGEQYEALILSKQGDIDAFSLSRFLSSQGIQCQRMDETASEEQISRAFLHAQVVLLCGAVMLPMGKQIRFARQVLRNAGGAIYQLGENNSLPSDLADRILSNGIAKSLFDDLETKK